MNDMERLTSSNDEIKTLQVENEEYWLKVYFKLKEYENLEEQGLLIRLPYKVGDTLYEVDDCGRTKRIKSFVVNDFKIYKTNRIEIYFVNASGFALCDFSGNLDEGWFLTREEAEVALERMK